MRVPRSIDDLACRAAKAGQRTRVLAALSAAVAVLSSAVGVALSAPAQASSRVVGPLSPPSGAWLGATSDNYGAPYSDAQWEAYVQGRETLAGRTWDIVNNFPGWTAPLDSQLVKWDISHGQIPLISWNTPNSVTDQSITDGTQDSLINAQALSRKSLNSPVFLRFDWEMNGNWFAWDGTHNGGPGDRAGRLRGHVAPHPRRLRQRRRHQRRLGLDSRSSKPARLPRWNAVTAYYPGDAYVDWVGLDDYNYGGTLGHAPGWNDFASQLQPIYGDFADEKPIMVGEMGSADHIAGHDKGQWIRQMAADVETSYPDVQALVWFDVKYDADWRFDTSATGLAAYRQLMADPYLNPSGKADPYAITPSPTTTSPTADPTSDSPVATSTSDTPSPSPTDTTPPASSSPAPTASETPSVSVTPTVSDTSAPSDSPTPTTTTPTPTATVTSTPTPTPTPTTTTPTPTPSPSRTTTSPTPSPSRTTSSPTPSPSKTTSSPTPSPTSTAKPGTGSLFLSTSSTRSSPKSLSGSSLGSAGYVYATFTGSPTKVSFYVDNVPATGTPYSTDSVAPYDLVAGSTVSTAKPYNATTLSVGQHTITAVGSYASGTSSVSAVITVGNGPSPSLITGRRQCARRPFVGGPAARRHVDRQRVRLRERQRYGDQRDLLPRRPVAEEGWPPTSTLPARTTWSPAGRARRPSRTTWRRCPRASTA